MNDLTVIIPCYNENPQIVSKTYLDLISMNCTVIVVDDGSTMDLPDYVKTIRYQPQMGYGYAIKQGIKAAETTLVCSMDGDGQHDVEDVKKLYTVYKMIPDCKMVVGSRWNLNEVWYRWTFRKLLNFLASCISTHYMVDLNSGIRVFDKKLASDYSNILCDTFSFTTSLTMSIVTDNYKMAYFPIDVKPRAYGKSRVKLLRDGLVTLYYIVWVGLALRTRGLRKWLRHIAGQ